MIKVNTVNVFLCKLAVFCICYKGFEDCFAGAKKCINKCGKKICVDHVVAITLEPRLFSVLSLLKGMTLCFHLYYSRRMLFAFFVFCIRDSSENKSSCFFLISLILYLMICLLQCHCKRSTIGFSISQSTCKRNTGWLSSFSSYLVILISSVPAPPGQLFEFFPKK